MRKAILNNWQIKLVCLALAAALWYLIRENVSPDPALRAPIPWSQPSP